MSVRIFFAWLLMIVGSLMALVSGGCTIFFIEAIKGFPGLGFVFGGVPFILGLFLLLIGKLLLPSEEKTKKSKFEDEGSIEV